MLAEPENLWQELQKERKRVIQWRILSEAAVLLNSELHSESLPLKFIKCAKKLVSANEAMVALKEEKKEGLKILKHYTLDNEAKEKQVEESGKSPYGAIEVILKNEEIINRNASQFTSQELCGFSAIKRNLLGVPLYAGGEVTGALLMANKRGEESFTQDDQELLLILASQLSIALENSRLYEKTDEKLQIKVDELEHVNKILVKQTKILEKSIEIHKQLTELVLRGKGIEAICRTLTAFIGCPVQIEDHNFNVKATTINNDLTNLFLCGKDLLENKEYTMQVKDLFQERKIIKIKLDTAAIQYVVPIVAGEQNLGIITAVLVNKPLRPLYLVAMEQGATIVALEMLKERSAAEQNRRLKENFLEQVLDGDFESEEQVQHRALQLNFGLNNIYQIMAVDMEPGDNVQSRPELYQEIREFCVDSFPNSIVVTKNDLLLIMVAFEQKNQERAIAKPANMLKEFLIKLVENGTWRIAIGTSCTKITDCAVSYRKAVTTLDIMKALRLTNKIVYYNNLGIFSLIEINPQRFADFTQKTLGLLMEYDQKHKTQLVDTLNLYFNYNSNVLKASREGYLNPSTMKYRLRRIQEITGLDLKDADVGLQLQLAMRLINCGCFQ